MANCFGSENQNSANGLRLVDLPTDALLCIFKLCDSSSLRNLCLTCKRLNEIVSADYLWIEKSSGIVVTNQLSDIILQRSAYKLSAKECCRIGTNWNHGCYEEKIYRSGTKYMPRLHLESDYLWISQGRSIIAVERIRNGLKMHLPVCNIQNIHTDDICRFVKTDDIIFSGGMDKYICGWSTSTNKLVLHQKSNHSQDILGLDCKRHILVSGSKDNSVKIWRLGETGDSLNCAQTYQRCDRVWCVTIDPTVSCVAAGSAGYNGVHPLHCYDLNSGLEIPLNNSIMKKGAAVYDIYWECPNTLLTTGFDSVTRLWDMRVARCVRRWTDPFGATGYCMATDQQYSILCGTGMNGRVQLWDKRSPASVQAYFGSNRGSSPVYSLSFDPRLLFIAQDSCVNVLDFSQHAWPEKKCNDYRTFWIQRQTKWL